MLAILPLGFPLIVGCRAPDPREHREPEPTSPTTPTTPPTVTTPDGGVITFEVPDNPDLHLVRRVSATSPVPTRIALEVRDATGAGRTISFPDLATEHVVPVLELRPDTEYTTDVTLTDASGVVVGTASFPFTSDPLPEGYPLLEVGLDDPARMEPGVTVFGPETKSYNFITAVDEEGVPVYALATAVTAAAIGHTPDGGWISIRKGTIETVTIYGDRTFRLAYGAPEPGDIDIPYEWLHHDVQLQPDGSLFTIGYEVVTVPDMHLSYEDPSIRGVAEVEVDRLVEFDASGQVVEEWPLDAYIPFERIGYGGLEPNHYDHLEWIHANAVVYDPDTASFTVSMRNQDALLSFDRATRDLRWILSHPFGWEPEEAAKLLTPTDPQFIYPVHQHGPAWVSPGVLAVFDNATHSSGTPYYRGPDDVRHSRVELYDIDEVAMTVTKVGELAETPWGTEYSGFYGSARPQPTTGNMIGLWGAEQKGEGDEWNATIGRGERSARILEATPDGDIVFELTVFGDLEDVPNGYKFDRAFRLPSLYPPGVTITAIP